MFFRSTVGISFVLSIYLCRYFPFKLPCEAFSSFKSMNRPIFLDHFIDLCCPLRLHNSSDHSDRLCKALWSVQNFIFKKRQKNERKKIQLETHTRFKKNIFLIRQHNATCKFRGRPFYQANKHTNTTVTMIMRKMKRLYIYKKSTVSKAVVEDFASAKLYCSFKPVSKVFFFFFHSVNLC